MIALTRPAEFWWFVAAAPLWLWPPVFSSKDRRPEAAATNENKVSHLSHSSPKYQSQGVE